MSFLCSDSMKRVAISHSISFFLEKKSDSKALRDQLLPFRVVHELLFICFTIPSIIGLLDQPPFNLQCQRCTL